MFNQEEAFRLLVEDRHKYIERIISFAQGFLDRNMDEAAMTSIVEGANALRQVDGAIQYVEQLETFNENGYPRFGPILE